MTPAEYFDPLLGQSVAYPGQEAYQGQCVQSVLLWLRDTGTEPPIYASAYMYYTQGIPGYTKVPIGAPIQDGDIVVWGAAFPPTKGNGHIDVATETGTNLDFWAYDQNWTPNVITKTHHAGSQNQYIMGYLRKDDSAMEDEIKQLTDQLNQTNIYLQQAQADIVELNKQLSATNGFVDKLTTRVTALEANSSPMPSDGNYSLKKLS